MRCIIILATFLLYASAYATDYYVAKTGSDANSCATAQNVSTPKLTIGSAKGCLSAGDTMYIREGTYLERFINDIPAGPSASVQTTISAYNDETVILRPSSSASSVRVLDLTSIDNVRFYGLDFDAINVTGEAIKFVGVDNVTIDGPAPVAGVFKCKIQNSSQQGSGGAGFQFGAGNNKILRNCEIFDNGLLVLTAPYSHGVYNSGGANVLIEGNYFHGNGCNAIQMYPNPTNGILRRNVFADNGVTSGCGTNVVMTNTGHIFEYNVLYMDEETGTGVASSTNVPRDHIIRHNTIYNQSTNCISISSAAINITVQNNLLIECGTAINNLGTGTVLTGNLSTGTAASHFTSTTSGAFDLTLKSSSTAINGGTDIGLAYCGSNPDQGAFETPVVTAASINGNLLDVTICSRFPPIRPLGTWTAFCTGAGCGTPVTSNVSLLGGSGGIVRVTVDGITGGACAAGQTWTISASGANTDSAFIGHMGPQPLYTTTNFPVDSSACDGVAAGGAPAGAIAIYAFEDNTNDSSGNSNHAIGSGSISYTTGHMSQGVLTTAGVNSYIDTGLLSGHNPSTSHLVIATWLYIDPANLGDTTDVFGTSLGTDQRLYVARHSGNYWIMGIGATNGTASEFPTVNGWTHVCLKMHPTGDIATLYINGVAGMLNGASVITGYGSYTFASTLRFGLPQGFATSLSGAHVFDDAYIYTTDVSCTDIYNAGQPPTATATVTQVSHQLEGVFTNSGVVDVRGDPGDQHDVVELGIAAVKAQLNCTGGPCGVVQPRFRYNINGGTFTNVVPDTATADGIYYWGSDIPAGFNNGVADGPIVPGLTHTDGITLTTSSAIPTIDMAEDTSYTLRGVFRIGAPIGTVVCFKIYDQGGSALASYTPAEGACLTVVSQRGAGVH